MVLTKEQLDDNIKAYRRQYMAVWRANNKDKIKQYNDKFYKKKLEEFIGEKIDVIE